MAKQQNNEDHLFENMDISGFENELLTVDNPDGEKLDEELGDGKVDGKKGKLGKGEPEKVKKPGEEEPGRKTKDNTIVVDKQPGEVTEDDEEEEGKGKDKKEKDKKGGSAPNDEGNESPVYLHAAALQEQGVLPNFDLKTLDGLEPEAAILKINEHIQTQIDESIQEGIEEYKSTLGEKAKKLVEDLEKGVPFESLADNYTLEERYGSITAKSLEADPELQEQIYSDFLTLKGFSEPKIKKMVEVAKEKETLLEDANDGLKDIQKSIANEKEQLRLDAENEKTAKEERTRKTKEIVQSTVKSTKEIFPGIPVTEEEQKEIVKMLTIPVLYTNKEGKKIPMSAAMAQRAKNPVAFEMKLAYFIKNGFFDDKIKDGAFDVFTKKVETSATKRLGQVLSGDSRTAGRPGSEVDRDKKKKDKEEKEGDFVFPQDMMKT
jgi:hypothetical protein